MFLVTAGEICSYIDNDLTNFMHTIVLIIEIGVPILLIIFGMLDFAKGVVAANEDDIKKGQRIFIKRAISAIVVFFIFSVTQLVIGLVANDDSEVWSCAAAIMNGTNRQISQTKYTPSNISNETKESCCAQAGGKLGSNGVCSGYNDENGERHNVNSEAYNQCTKNLEKQKENEQQKEFEKKQTCCTQAGGKIDTNNECSSWNDEVKDEFVEVDRTKYNQCMGK